jgi:hypothetical protein
MESVDFSLTWPKPNKNNKISKRLQNKIRSGLTFFEKGTGGAWNGRSLLLPDWNGYS